MSTNFGFSADKKNGLGKLPENFCRRPIFSVFGKPEFGLIELLYKR